MKENNILPLMINDRCRLEKLLDGPEKNYEKEQTFMKDNITKAGKNTIIAYLKNLKNNDETGYLKEDFEVLKEKNR